MFSSPGSLILIVAVVVWLGLFAAAAGHAVMYKRDPRSAAIWSVVGFALPGVGPALYWAFGINRVERHAVKKLGRRERPFDPGHLLGHEDPYQAHVEAVGHLVSLRTIADRVARLPLLPGNALTPLHNGEQAYPRMLKAIGEAQRSITLASYIFDWDDVGREFAHALSGAAGRGVHVHLLVDGLGALRSFSRVGRRLLKSGAEVAAFFPLRFPFGRFRLNLRNHRKILVADGRVGFTGGMNISERHLHDAQQPGRVEDLHFEVTGPVVAEMQHAFAEDWALSTAKVLRGEDYFPSLAPTGRAVCRGVSSGPDEDFESIHWMVQAAIASAQQSVCIVTPYFIPTSSLLTTMIMRALRGIDITLVLPSLVDLPYMRWAADAYLWQLLEHGIRVYRRPPPFVHTKLMLVDERWVLLGSANMDPRSFRLNFEFNIEAYEVTLARELSGWFSGLIADLQPVTLEEMDSRPRVRRLRDGLAKLASPFL